MFKNLIRKLIEFIKSHFTKNIAEKTDELSQIEDISDRLSHELKPAGSSEKIMETTIALRHINLMRKSLNIMMSTTEPEIFSAKYDDLLTLAERISEFEYIDKKAQTAVYDIIDKLNTMRASVPDAEENGLVYYSVTFGNKPKEYYYLSGGKQYEAGQYVLVPVNDDMELKVVKIVSVDRFTGTNAPMPSEKLKSIISRAMRN